MDAQSNSSVITVGELNRRARELIESGFALQWVVGEISNFTRALSGHCYFSLKDAQAQVRCVLFRHKAALLEFQPANGMQVEVHALATLYEVRGDFQLGIETMRRSGLGLLFEAFERLKKKLETEGLFDPARKRPLPAFPRAIGVVTSPAAAALRDVLATLRRRMPSIPVVLYPAPVQGEGAADKIAQAIRGASLRAEVDVIVVCRGGGSIEDLWAYNEEVVARAIAQSAIPVVTGVGHETDFTIADFVADARAPTPTAAAALVAPDRSEIAQQLAGINSALSRNLWRVFERRMQQLDFLARRLVHPGQRILMRRDQLVHLRMRLSGAWRQRVDGAVYRVRSFAARLVSSRPGVEELESLCRVLTARFRASGALYLERRQRSLEALSAHLEHLNPQAVLGRGYSIVSRDDGRIVRDSAEIEIGSRVSLSFARGRAGASIESKE
ncbi:MAG: exodeoxyribonuclease VII large subunit [Burkholderiales bacterium]